MAYLVTQHNGLPCHWYVGFSLPCSQNIFLELLVITLVRTFSVGIVAMVQLARHDYVTASTDGCISL